MWEEKGTEYLVTIGEDAGRCYADDQNFWFFFFHAKGWHNRANRDSPSVWSQNEKKLRAEHSRVSAGLADLQSSTYNVIKK